MNISLDNHFERFVAEMVASGRFKSSHEVVREALRLLEEREIRFRRLTLEIKRVVRVALPFRSIQMSLSLAADNLCTDEILSADGRQP